MKSFLLLFLSLAALNNAVAIPTSDIEWTTQVDARYACARDSDCVVVNHGNCCGASITCALAHAKFTDDEICPAGHDTAGICGFETIEVCVCQQGVCYGFQGGKVSSSPKEWQKKASGRRA
ncbi:hypothetical protein AJ78_01709 [Emergomyces pasteurianus Ep9510]|uniref:Uncharacterized protein n=1 Tax=Emergomyces pasteurianus Ep9510 TaxID=1447872 RepID=A0A1J9PQ14_9EURO|nr:hypothetical protein AJ78_01709 [Emergomyces pasteurianus Ep9510]